jgi:hypothetical protein
MRRATLTYWKSFTLGVLLPDSPQPIHGRCPIFYGDFSFLSNNVQKSVAVEHRKI